MLTIQEFPSCPQLPSKPFLYTLANKHGLELQLLNYGATIRSLKVPDKNGKQVDVVLGFNTLEEYHEHTVYFGATVGRTAGRICGGKFSIPEGSYELAKNEKGKTTLHGGVEGYNRKFWTVEVDPVNPLKIVMKYKSVDGEEGYPGNAFNTVTFEVSAEETSFTISYEATVDKACPLHLTNHSYFNLNGEDSGVPVLNNEIVINSSFFLPLDTDSIPTGEKTPVEGTPMDFRKMTPIGKRIHDFSFEQLKIVNGYDHPWLLDKSSAPQCEAYSPSTGIEMKIRSNEPAVVVYTANYLDGKLKGKSGKPYVQHYGFSMETSQVENAVNMKDFPNTVLRPGEKYHQVTTFAFSVKK
eukprot:TRINITY_DN7890_c0_g1_i1.p1 TRINITY_DN7890_c0_g1~~TRINITY_DN7890_c0_g1_i1.p1  ORF type:complete len:354 (-),score=73.00 TRINITY_DN7890_c0_g1_i1:52-1113(-)